MGSHVSTHASIVTGTPATPAAPLQQAAVLILRTGSRSIQMVVETHTIHVDTANIRVTYHREAGSADAIEKALCVWGRARFDAGEAVDVLTNFLPLGDGTTLYATVSADVSVSASASVSVAVSSRMRLLNALRYVVPIALVVRSIGRIKH